VRILCLGLAMLTAAVLPTDAAAELMRASSRPEAAVAELGAGWLEAAWKSYKQRFIRSGRVIDDVNQISHSEGQGYAMLIAVKAGDRSGFDEIWQWTRRELYINDSGLAAWKWDDRLSPHVPDQNNASDGDILIAWALIEAGNKWKERKYTDAARPILAALDRLNTALTKFGLALIPGRIGFSPEDQPDGQVLNLSYWVFPAFERFKEVGSETDWAAVQATGLQLLKESRFGPLKLPADWIAIGSGKPAPAKGFPANFSYNAIRIPLYLTWAKITQADLLRPFASLWNETLDLGPFEVEVASGSAITAFGGKGFKAAVAMAKCALSQRKIHPSLRKVDMGSDYSTTLHILSLIAVQERYPECL
jgi:endo-1,4-beta-D-glucanase Y